MRSVIYIIINYDFFKVPKKPNHHLLDFENEGLVSSHQGSLYFTV